LGPVDHPAVTAATLRALIEALDASGAELARPSYRGRGGHPPLIARALWPALVGCTALPDGARGVVRAARSVGVELDDPGTVHDVDTPDDLEALA
ncbi:MAG TPA: NTP transferase domain-containing protein, partial [Kofleriaceae bacterium]|nr:NTP transferase domain-containing protein [Kofleriaceae bacterium]